MHLELDQAASHAQLAAWHILGPDFLLGPQWKKSCQWIYLGGRWLSTFLSGRNCPTVVDGHYGGHVALVVCIENLAARTSGDGSPDVEIDVIPHKSDTAVTI